MSSAGPVPQITSLEDIATLSDLYQTQYGDRADSEQDYRPLYPFKAELNSRVSIWRGQTRSYRYGAR
jgi:hypothetical protein